MKGWSTELPIDNEAGARALALCNRVRNAIDHSRELAARTAATEATLAATRADVAAARQTRQRQRDSAARVPWAWAARRLTRSFVAPGPVARQPLAHPTPVTGRPLHEGAASGRVVRRPPNRRGAAARAAKGDGSDGSDGDLPALPRDTRIWAHAPVFAERVVFDSDGIEWTVRELDATALPGARSPRCLIVENHQVVRKIWHYPADWTEYGDAALLALSEELR